MLRIVNLLEYLKLQYPWFEHLGSSYRILLSNVNSLAKKDV